MIRWFTAVPAFLFLSLALAGGNFIGNGGEGYMIDGKLVLRDLAENGLARGPLYFGTEIDPALRAPWGAGFPGQVQVPRELLLRKLTDLNSAIPHLGVYVVEVLKQYAWVHVDEPLTQIPDESGFMDLKPVTIANRWWKTIRVQRALWQQLPEEHRVALIVHEALYALARPICETGNGFAGCSQRGRLVRDLTGWLFAPSLAGAGLPVPASLSDGLMLPWHIEKCAHERASVRASAWSTRTGRTEWSSPVYGEADLLPENRARVAGALCGQFAGRLRDHGRVDLDLRRLPFRVGVMPIGGQGLEQLALSLLPRAGRLNVTIYPAHARTRAVCESVLLNHLNEWLDGRTASSAEALAASGCVMLR